MNSYCKKQLALVIIFAFPIVGAQSVSDFQLASHLKQEAQDKIDKDIHLIESAIGLLIRPQFEGIPTVLQKLNGVNGTSGYYFPGEALKSQAVIDSRTNDEGKDIIIFPMGENGFGHRTENSYVVLRKSKGARHINTYFLNMAYLRKSGEQTMIEWSTVEIDQFRKSPLEMELCRKDQCEFPEWILGTCQIVEHSCDSKNTIHPEAKAKNVLEDENLWQTKMGAVPVPVLQKRSARSPIDVLAGEDTKSIDGNEALRVPSSLDLLMRPKKTKDTDDDSNFRNSILKTREVDNDHLENVALMCTQCQNTFDFFWDLEEQSLEFSQQVGKRIKKEFFSGQVSSLSVFHVLKEHPNIPFVGFGNCNYSLEDLTRPKSNEIDDITEFYLGTLQKDCDHIAQSDLRGWLTSKLKFLRIETDLTLGLVKTSQLLKSEMFSSEEFGMVISVILFQSYSNIYNEERSLITSDKTSIWAYNPVGLKISESCRFITRLFLRLITYVHQVLDNHLVKSLRAIIRYLKDKFLSLLVEKQKLLTILSHDFNPNSYKQLISNDLNQIMALKEFTLYGLGPVYKSGTTPEVAFESFYKLNKKRIDFLIKAYDS